MTQLENHQYMFDPVRIGRITGSLTQCVQKYIHDFNLFFLFGRQKPNLPAKIVEKHGQESKAERLRILFVGAKF